MRETEPPEPVASRGAPGPAMVDGVSRSAKQDGMGRDLARPLSDEEVAWLDAAAG